MHSLILYFLSFFYITLVSASSPSGGYAPGVVQCPANLNGSSLIREANSISSSEKEWIEKRQLKSNQALVNFLGSANLDSFNAEKFVNENNSSGINLGLAFSGGSYRAMLNSAGALMALDDRTTFNGSLGGILQSANYIGALSGSSWLLGSLAMQNFTSVEELVNQTSLWTIIWPVLTSNLYGALSHVNFWSDGIESDIQAKQKAGFNTSLTDVWGRALAHQLFPQGDNNYDSGSTWSDIRNMEAFANQDMPFPFVTGLGRKPNTVVYNLNSTVIEMNPFEFGSFDPSLNTFTDIKFLGTNVNNGVPVDSCVNGFDNSAFIIGSSSSLFNQFLNTLACDDCNSLNWIVKWIVKNFLSFLSKNNEDIALYKPNPFYNSQYASSDNITTSDTLYVIDGGLGDEVIPLSTLMIKERKLDVVFAFDASVDTSTSWPDGRALISSYERQFAQQGSSNLCPYVPDTNTFLQKGLTAKPTFFGCDAKNLTDLVKDDVIPPLVVYFANRPYEFYSNVSTYDLTFTDEAKKGIIQNGFDVATRLNGTIDPEFKTCLACAIIRREEERRGVEQSDQCKKCFDNYCWDGTYAETPDPGYVNFTDSGLTNDSTVYYGTANSKVQASSGLFGFLKRDKEVEDVFELENSGNKFHIPTSLSVLVLLAMVFIV
ncbi:PLB2 Lysophospholipase 2 [Candida maltosa Xu316]